jgi:hypothetical protein
VSGLGAGRGVEWTGPSEGRTGDGIGSGRVRSMGGDGPRQWDLRL